MHPFAFVSGCALVALAVLELAWSTLSAEGAGPLTRRVGQGVWRALTHRAAPDARRRRAAGALVLLATAALWVGLVVGGWALVFAGLPGHVASSSTGAPADLGDRLYFGGYAVATLGNGDFRPATGLAQALTVAAALSGLFLITLTVTYLLPVISAVTEARRLASSIHALGASGEEIVRRAWDGRGFTALERQLERVADALTLHTERHFTYPVIHYFEGGERRTAFAPNVAALADALLLLGQAVAEEVRPAPSALRGLDAALGTFADTLGGSFVGTAGEAPPAPSAARLAGAVPLAAEPGVGAAAARRVGHRSHLLRYVRESGYAWPRAPS